MYSMIKQTTKTTSFAVELERETDGRWIAEIPNLPGVMVYGSSKREALTRVYALALRTLAANIEEGRMVTRVSRWFEHGMARH